MYQCCNFLFDFCVNEVEIEDVRIVNPQEEARRNWLWHAERRLTRDDSSAGELRHRRVALEPCVSLLALARPGLPATSAVYAARVRTTVLAALALVAVLTSAISRELRYERTDNLDRFNFSVSLIYVYIAHIKYLLEDVFYDILFVLRTYICHVQHTEYIGMYVPI